MQDQDEARCSPHNGPGRSRRRGAIHSGPPWLVGPSTYDPFIHARPGLLAPNVQLRLVAALAEHHARQLRWRHGLSCHVCLLRPRSRGTLALASADPLAAPWIDPGFLQGSEEVRELIEGYKLTRDLMHPPSMKAVWTKEFWSGGVEGDDAIEALLRRRVDTVYHPAGICRIESTTARSSIR